MPLSDALPSFFPDWGCRGSESDMSGKRKDPSGRRAVGDTGRKRKQHKDEKDLFWIILALWL